MTGDITVNGETMSNAFFLDNAAYVPQEDRLWSALTGDDDDAPTPPGVFETRLAGCLFLRGRCVEVALARKRAASFVARMSRLLEWLHRQVGQNATHSRASGTPNQ